MTGLLEQTTGKITVGGGSNPSTLFVEPTVVSDITLSDPLMQEEIFGPILPVLSVPSIAAACALIPQISDKPLGLYLLSEVKEELDYVVEHTLSGGVSLNDVMTQIAVPNLPFGGVGASGIGSYHGKASVDTFSHRKSVVSVPKEADEAFEWRYPSGDQLKKFHFYKENLEARF